MRFFVNAAVISPTAITANRGTGNQFETLTHLPGATIRGALAQAYLDAGGGVGDEAFQSLFLRPGTRFSEFRPEGSTSMPLSARCCANDPDGRAHRMIDLLLAEAAGAPLPVECAECGEKLKAPPGFLNSRGAVRVPDTRQVAHVEIDRFTQRARSGQFHTGRVIEAGQNLQGWVHASDEKAAAALESLIGEGLALRIGRGRTRGQGSVRLSFWGNREAEESEQAILRRLSECQEAASWHAGLAAGVIFAIQLDSPAVLLDRWMFSRLLAEPSDLGPEFGDYRLAAAFSRSTIVRGWHAAGRVPKCDQPAVASGSIYLYVRKAGDREAELGRIAPALARLAAAGIGEKTGEGYGHVIVAPRFVATAAYRPGGKYDQC